MQSCGLADDRVALAEEFIRSDKESGSFPAAIIKVDKLNGEDYKGKVFPYQDLHDLYKINLKITYIARQDGYLYIDSTDGFAWPEVYKEGQYESTHPLVWDNYYKQNIHIGDTFFCSTTIKMKKTDNGWQVLGY